MIIDALAELDARTENTMIFVLPIFDTTIPAAVAQVYVPFNTTSIGNLSILGRGWPAPTPMRLSNLYVRVQSNTLNRDGRVIVAYNNVQSLLRVSIPAGQVGLFSNTTTTINIEAGDAILIVFDTTAASSGQMVVDGVAFAARLAP
ncbi:MAG: hypothetical protein QXH97_00270 [Candidatus Bathyarchaeia archaeon]